MKNIPRKKYVQFYATSRKGIFRTIDVIILLSIIVVVALIVRLNGVIREPERINSGFGPFGDTYFYHRIAYNLYVAGQYSATYDGRAYGENIKEEVIAYEPTAIRGPVYPFFMCAIYKLLCNKEDMTSKGDLHKNFDKVRIVQCIIDASLCILIFFIVHLIYPTSFVPALLASFLHCLNFYNIFYTKALLSETVTAFFVTLLILLFIFSLKRGKKWCFFLSGICTGTVILSRFEYSLFIAVLALLIYLFGGKPKLYAIKNAFLFLTGTAVVILPWTIRNYIAFNKVIPVSYGTFGYVLWQGTFETNEVWSRWGDYPDDIFSDEKERERVMNLEKTFNSQLLSGDIAIVKTDKEFMKMALKRIRDDPFKCFKNWIIKIPRLWYQMNIQMYVYKEPSGMYFIFYFCFALYAVIFSRSSERIFMFPIVLLFVYLTIIFLPLHVEARYGVTAIPSIVSLTGIGIWKFLNKIFSHRPHLPEYPDLSGEPIV